GLAANGAVWDPLLEIARDDWSGTILVPDLAGHGRSERRPSYSYGAFASELGQLVESGQKVHVIGHSLGAALGGLLGVGWFGVELASLLALSLKIKWAQEEIDGAKEIA